jgi:hypothetical protein
LCAVLHLVLRACQYCSGGCWLQNEQTDWVVGDRCGARVVPTTAGLQWQQMRLPDMLPIPLVLAYVLRLCILRVLLGPGAGDLCVAGTALERC